ncbi:MAG TPA: single-stranded DNA-binding protein [Longimicrobiales bacterium]|nr:single-stranded DNA-binding protein [Longimicrobiales bacterium]
MSRSLNKVMLIGNVGSDPEIKTTGGGTKMAKLSLATNRTFSDRSGQQQEKTEWHRLTFWERLAELVEQYVKKGDRLYIEGRIEYSQTEDDKGNQRYWTDIIVREMVMLGSSGAGGGGGGGGGYEGGQRRRPAAPPGGGRPAGGGPGPSPFEAEDDDLPF